MEAWSVRLVGRWASERKQFGFGCGGDFLDSPAVLAGGRDAIAQDFGDGDGLTQVAVEIPA